MTAAARSAVAWGVLILGGAGSASAAQPNIKDGLWEITMKMEMPGMPGAAPPQTLQRCFSAKDFEDPGAMSRDKSMQCETSDYRLQGNTASWKIVCKGEGAMTGSGTATYGGTTYTMTSRMAMTHGGQTMNMTTTHTGKYLGPCKK
jgi:hypothetical protein